MTRSRLGREMRACAAAFAFMTRLPVTRLVPHDLTDLGNATGYFPLVGLCVGLIGAISFALAQLLWTPLVAATLCTIATVLLTGAFHEDALADSLDGFGGGWTKDQVLSIMKDSRVGSYALIGVVLAVVLKISALLAIHDGTAGNAPTSTATLLAPGTIAVGRALVAAHVLARWSSVWLIRTHTYVRIDDPATRPSAGRPFANSVTNGKLATATILSLTIVAVVLGVHAIGAVAAAIVSTWIAGRYFSRRIGGITGDALGAANQFVEIVLYLVLAVRA